jgi:hypothetical protein
MQKKENNFSYSKDILVEVKSSQVKAIGYLEKSGVIVKFSNDSEYLYKDVPKDVFDNLAKSESVGKFLSSNIKGRYEFIKINTSED